MPPFHNLYKFEDDVKGGSSSCIVHLIKKKVMAEKIIMNSERTLLVSQKDVFRSSHSVSNIILSVMLF